MSFKPPRHVVDTQFTRLFNISACTNKEAMKSDGLALIEEFEIVLPGGDRACLLRLFGDGEASSHQYVWSDKAMPIEVIFKA